MPRVGNLQRMLDLATLAEGRIGRHLELLADTVRPKNLRLATFVLVQAVDAVTTALVLSARDFDEDEVVEELAGAAS